MATQLHDTLTLRRDQALARLELALEATRRPELHAIYDRAGATFRDPARGLMAALGATDPTREEIRDGLLELFRGMLMETAV